MPSYMIISPHTAEECTRVIRDTLATGYLTHFEWGCKDDEHTGWAIIEAENKPEVLLAVPPSVRHKARAIQLTKFTPGQVEKWHAK